MRLLEPINQKQLFGLEKYFNEFVKLDLNKRFPNKVLLSGNKGIGKSTLALHYINYVLSKDEDFKYDKINFKIDSNNHSFKITLNKTNPNFYLIDVNSEKKMIDINQIRELIINLSKSSFNKKPRFILIDNIEYLNINSINALLKIIEEPPKNVFFFLINNNKKIKATLKSRCIEYKISISNNEAISIANKILNIDTFELINTDLINYYITPGKIYDLIKFSENNSIELKDINLKNLLSLIIDKSLYKKDNQFKYIFYELIEFYLSKRNYANNRNFFNHFQKKMENLRKFNLDEESLFIEFKQQLMNG